MDVDRETLKAAWNEFVATGAVSGGAVRDEILRSWQRCRADGLDPRSGTVPSHLMEPEKKNILRENRVLIEAARPFLEGLSNSSRTFMVLSSPTATDIILDAIGDGKSGNTAAEQCRGRQLLQAKRPLDDRPAWP